MSTPCCARLLHLPAPNHGFVSRERQPPKQTRLITACTGLRGVKVSVDLSQILASGVPIEEIVREHPYEQCRPSNLSFSLPLVASPHSLALIVFCSSKPNLSLSFSSKISAAPSFIMYFSLLPASVLLSLAVAQTTISGSSASSTACAAQPVMDACYASTSAIAQACATTDYGCLCSKWNDVLT